MQTLFALHEMKRNQQKMISDRGFIVNREVDPFFDVSYEDFVSLLEQYDKTDKDAPSPQHHLRCLYTHADDPKRKIYVHFASKTDRAKTQIGTELVNTINATVNTISEDDKYSVECVLIIDSPLSSSAQNVVKGINLSRAGGQFVKFQVFDQSEMLYNPTEHIDVPRHELLTVEEKARVIKEMKTDIGRLPLMSINDPIAKYYGWNIGCLIRIHRDDSYISVLAPLSINYRVVIGAKE